MSLSSGYRPQSNGQTKTKPRAGDRAALRGLLRPHLLEQTAHLGGVRAQQSTLQHHWSHPIPLCLWLSAPIISCPGEEGGSSVGYGFRAAMPTHLDTGSPDDASECRQIQYKKASDRHRSAAPQHREGQKVRLATWDLPLRTDSRKLTPRFIGPFQILEVINPVAVRLKLPRSMRVHPTFHVSCIKPAKDSALVPVTPPPPPPQLMDGEPVYTVKQLMACRRRGRGCEYLVDWEGYGPEERSWVSASNILDPSLLTPVPSLCS